MNAQLQEQRQHPHNDKDHNQQKNDNVDNALLVNILSNQRPETLPDPLTPIHPASEDPPMQWHMLLRPKQKWNFHRLT